MLNDQLHRVHVVYNLPMLNGRVVHAASQVVVMLDVNTCHSYEAIIAVVKSRYSHKLKKLWWHSRSHCVMLSLSGIKFDSF